MVSETNQAAGSSSSHLTPGLAVPAIQTVGEAQTSTSQAYGLSFIRKCYENRGIPANTIDIMCASWRAGSAKQYGVYLKKWIHFCSQREDDPFSIDQMRLLRFLTELYEKGLGYSGLNTARSALSAAFSYEEQTIGSLHMIKRFMKGVFETRPPSPRYDFIWDVNIVLDYLKNFVSQDIPLSYLTFKLVMLLALVTARRAQTLHLLNIEHFIFIDEGILIPIPYMLKQSSPRKYNFSLRLSSNPENSDICVVLCLKEYLKRTENLRKDEKQLFISFNKPHKKVSRSTISRWIKLVLREAGIDVDIFKAHSTRSAACSNAKKNGVTLEHIMKTAGWANAETFKKFYDKRVYN